jgi:hypothetical protein
MGCRFFTIITSLHLLKSGIENKNLKEHNMKMKRLFVIILLVLPLVLPAGEKKEQDVWKPFQFFVGKWQGAGEGKSGKSTVEREYYFKLDKKFIFNNNRAVFLPSEKNTKGEIHEDFGVISFDKIRKKYVFRQFHVEGFVNNYLATISPDHNTYTFVSESLENMPPGWKVRLVIKKEGNDEFSERFELAGPGKEFGCLITNRFSRKK